jgi:hypothetical protein
MVAAYRREIIMTFVRRRIDLICFGLYLAAALVGISLDAIAQVLPH